MRDILYLGRLLHGNLVLFMRWRKEGRMDYALEIAYDAGTFVSMYRQGRL